MLILSDFGEEISVGSSNVWPVGANL